MRYPRCHSTSFVVHRSLHAQAAGSESGLVISQSEATLVDLLLTFGES